MALSSLSVISSSTSNRNGSDPKAPLWDFRFNLVQSDYSGSNYTGNVRNYASKAPSLTCTLGIIQTNYATIQSVNKFGGGSVLNSYGGYILLPNHDFNTYPVVSISYWFSTPDTSYKGHLCMSSSGYTGLIGVRYITSNSNTLRYYKGDGNFNSYTINNYCDNNFHHFVCVFGKGINTHTIYIDGSKIVDIDASSFNSSFLSTTTANAIARSSTLSTLAGRMNYIDSLKLFPYALTQSQVTTLYTASSENVNY